MISSKSVGTEVFGDPWVGLVVAAVGVGLVGEWVGVWGVAEALARSTPT